ncbi:sulfurtransferase [Streptomyces yangpuensis]|uniref:Sulfurtransferase n=1 Tax=Streptomyces yangpuensis TaxID=1648182 RepID=A0ABY5Q2J8_9ACTN|nr:sulfurtransferase [Streptomyces yangpuensis]MBZ9598062.1 sulfurtransferase [Streptomyces erythrochromogenes]UUY49865.1 sulfurtransferase [Streptomyces yangpuensis]
MPTSDHPASREPGPADPGPLVGADWLAARLGEPGLVVFDASVGAHRAAARRIPGARPFDLDGDLSDHAAAAPHTMPGAAEFTEALRSLGLDDTDTVVVYDGAGIYSSARAWWMLRAMGFDRAAVLDGGLPAWAAAGLPVEDAGPRYEGPRGSFTARPRPGLLIDAEEVAAALADPAAAVLDARTRERFEGTAPEPRPGLRGGHMPGAVSLPFGELQRPDGLMRPAAQLRAVFEATAGDRERLRFSCGSGVTACVLALGADLAGYRDLAVYDGSWSEWGLPSPLRPVATGPAPAPAGPGGSAEDHRPDLQPL